MVILIRKYKKKKRFKRWVLYHGKTKTNAKICKATLIFCFVSSERHGIVLASGVNYIYTVADMIASEQSIKFLIGTVNMF